MAREDLAPEKETTLRRKFRRAEDRIAAGKGPVIPRRYSTVAYRDAGLWSWGSERV